MQKSETIGELAKALALAQAEIEGAKKDSENPFFRSKYADLASVRDACQSALSKQGIAVVQVPATAVMENATVVSVETLMMHSSGEWISGDLGAVPVKDDPQGIGSCITYLRRYALAAFAGVAPEDDDGNAASQGNGKPPARTAAKNKPNEAEPAQIKQALVNTCKLLNAAGDKPLWGAKRLDEFSMQEYGRKADDLEIEPLRDLLKKMSNRLDEVRKGIPKPSGDPTEVERLAMVAKIQAKHPEAAIKDGLKSMAEQAGREDIPTLEQLSLDQLIVLNEEIIPF